MSDSEETDNSCAEWSITKDWLEGVLQEYLGKESQPEVVEYTVRPGCNNGESVLSDILAIGLEYKRSNQHPAEQLNVIVKRLPQDPYSRFFVTEAQFDLREIRFYTQVRFAIHIQSSFFFDGSVLHCEKSFFFFFFTRSYQISKYSSVKIVPKLPHQLNCQYHDAFTLITRQQVVQRTVQNLQSLIWFWKISVPKVTRVQNFRVV